MNKIVNQIVTTVHGRWIGKIEKIDGDIAFVKWTVWGVESPKAYPYKLSELVIV